MIKYREFKNYSSNMQYFICFVITVVQIHQSSSKSTVHYAFGQKAFKLANQDVKGNAVSDLRLNKRIQKQFYKLLDDMYDPKSDLYKESEKSQRACTEWWCMSDKAKNETTTSTTTTTTTTSPPNPIWSGWQLTSKRIWNSIWNKVKRTREFQEQGPYS